MSADHESSYYEIALTNRQVLTIFVVLLTCMVLAFLSGVWIGRRDGAPGPLEASAGESLAEQATAQMTELNFFSQSSQRGEASEPPPEAAPQRPAPAAPESTPERQPQPVESSPPASRPAAQEPTPAPAARSGRVIQVFSTPDKEQATKILRRLVDGRYPAYLVEESLEGGTTTYRVRVGPYDEEAKAQQVADELRREYRLDTWITSQAG